MKKTTRRLKPVPIYGRWVPLKEKSPYSPRMQKFLRIALIIGIAFAIIEYTLIVLFAYKINPFGLF